MLDENIEQIESKFSLKEINSQLPSENLLDRYNFGYINLIDDDDGLKQSAFKETRPKIKWKGENKYVWWKEGFKT